MRATQSSICSITYLDYDVVITERSRGDRLFMRVFAVDHTGLARLGVRVHCVPDLTDPGTGGIDNLHLPEVMIAGGR